jgi:hypothetical protein
MSCPFPGMDPFIESQAWPDFHTRFITEIADLLMPHLRPRYFARLEERVYVEQETNGAIRTIRPDLTVVKDAAQPSPPSTAVATVTTPVSLRIAMPEKAREAYLEIRLRDTGEVVTVIELLSSANKRPGSDGRREYLRKRSAVLGSDVHLLELDLLRGGDRLPMEDPLPPGDHYAILSRAPRRPTCDVWFWTLAQPLPSVPVPLAGDDPDITLHLQSVMRGVYERAGYDYSLDYRAEVDPPLDHDAQAWVREQLAAWR